MRCRMPAARTKTARHYIVEKRAGMTKRDRFVCATLAKKCRQAPEGMQ